MRPDDVRRHGAALAERVRHEVDTSMRLELMLRRHRWRRRMVYAAAATAALVLVVGSLWLARTDSTPVVTEPPPSTAPETTSAVLQSLPVQAYMVLLSDYAVVSETGACQGAGPLDGIAEGSDVEVIGPPPASENPTVALPPGKEVTSDGPSSFLLPDGVGAACVFTLPDLGFAIDDYDDVTLLPASDPDIASGMVRTGQRVIFRFGDLPGEPGGQAAPGVVSDVPEEWQAELTALRNSAGPGRIVGFVNLAAPHHSGAPGSPRQPVCVGVGPYRDVTPGAAVVVMDTAGDLAAEAILRGAAYDGHIGCSLWFGVDVPPDLSTYVLSIGDHPMVVLDRATLDGVGWIADLWSDELHMQANCVEAEPESRPMTCVLLEPAQ